MTCVRDIVGDVGTKISTETELSRPDSFSVLQAACRRLTEAIRCLEEYSKIDSPELAGRIESLRYRAYQLEKQIIRRANAADSFTGVRLYVLLTERLCRLPILEVARQVLAGGADCVQLREKDKADAELLGLAKKISQMCHDADALFIMNDRPDLAVLANADGVHLGQSDMAPSLARKIISPGMIVGKSTHSVAEAESVLAQEVDYIAVGAIFATGTKPGVSPVGVQLIEQVKGFCQRPIIAIGGITAENARQVTAGGASGIAVCQAIIASPEPGQATRQLKNCL